MPSHFAHIGRRCLLGGVMALALPFGAQAARVHVFRGSSSGDSSSENAPEAGPRVIRPGQTRRPPTGQQSRQLAEVLAASPNRYLKLFHAHTGERLSITYWRYGRYNEDAKPVIAWFLRDWRQRKASPISLSLLDTLWAVQAELAGQGDAPLLHLTSAFRTRQTNEALARSGAIGVARDSFHLKGMAADIHCPTRSYTALADACGTLAPGGFGTYRSAGFVHIDAGPSRQWSG